MANIPADLRYTKDHEYVKQTGDKAVVQVGITDYAQGELGDVVYVDLPKVGAVLARGDVFGTIEAVNQVLSPLGWQINTAFVERINLSLRQHVAAIGRRVSTLCKGEEGLRQQLAVYHVYYN